MVFAMKIFRIPNFATETDESQWFQDHSAELAQACQPAGVPEHLPLDSFDVSRAQTLAAHRGISVQAYLQMLLRRALDEEQKKYLN